MQIMLLLQGTIIDLYGVSTIHNAIFSIYLYEIVRNENYSAIVNFLSFIF